MSVRSLDDLPFHTSVRLEAGVTRAPPSGVRILRQS